MAQKVTKYNFDEKKTEYNSKTGKEAPVWLSPRYLEAKKKAIETLESDQYKGVLEESDFWILKNALKNGNISYTGLIISHNGCLKINDALPPEKRFDPSCVTIDKAGFNGSLVFIYQNEKQGIYEVGEVSARNCKNEYPYAMSLKRCMDRVILKASRLAYSGIYSDSEAEEFKEPERVENTVEVNEKVTSTPTDPAPERAVPTPPPMVVLPEGENPRKILVDYCNQKGININDVAKEYKLNNESSNDEFMRVLSILIDLNEK